MITSVIYNISSHILHPVIWARSQKQGLYFAVVSVRCTQKQAHTYAKEHAQTFFSFLLFTSLTHAVKHSFGLFLGIQAWICSNSIQCKNLLYPEPDSTLCSRLAEYQWAFQSKREWKGKPTYGVRRPLTLKACLSSQDNEIFIACSNRQCTFPPFLKWPRSGTYHIGHNSIRFSSGDHQIHTAACLGNTPLRY